MNRNEYNEKEILREKLADSKDFPKVAEIDCTKTKRWGEGTFVIPAPLEVDAAMKRSLVEPPLS